MPPKSSGIYTGRLPEWAGSEVTRLFSFPPLGQKRSDRPSGECRAGVYHGYMPTITRRLAFGLLAVLWLPVGIAATAPVRSMPWPVELHAWLSLVVTAPCGLPLALACLRLRRIGYPGTAWAAFAVLAPATAVASLFAGLLGPVAIAIYALVISVPAWILYAFLRRRR